MDSSSIEVNRKAKRAKTDRLDARKLLMMLMRYYLEIDNKIPPFRINELTYKEISQALYGRTVWPFSSDDLKKRIEAIIEGFEGSSE